MAILLNNKASLGIILLFIRAIKHKKALSIVDNAFVNMHSSAEIQILFLLKLDIDTVINPINI
ncbi:hypothetical protein [Cognaticolwellia beringensis]|uniref:Uncharacterized protein n=1 Tax=Cognaticolwellia beringensis TaxID=1967665 RepID=A0A222G5J9_9GAMM|nr:hypothetical protein [Cognaticolwellia beringensis]ASP47197.1 hypothetical protein B5D82_05145 [Cognaticolwellia beringensis]